MALIDLARLGKSRYYYSPAFAFLLFISAICIATPAVVYAAGQPKTTGRVSSGIEKGGQSQFEGTLKDAQEQYKENNCATAIAILERMQKDQTLKPEQKVRILYELGKNHCALGNIEKASSLFEQVVENRAAAHTAGVMGECYLKLGYLEIRKGNYYDGGKGKSAEFYFSECINDGALQEYLRDEARLRRGYIQLKKIKNDKAKLSIEDQKRLFDLADKDFRDIIIDPSGKKKLSPFELEVFFRKATLYLTVDIADIVSPEQRKKNLDTLKEKFPSYAQFLDFLDKISEQSPDRHGAIPYDEDLITLIDALSTFIRLTTEDTNTRQILAEVHLWIGNLYYQLSVHRGVYVYFRNALNEADAVFEMAEKQTLFWRIIAGAHILRADCSVNLCNYDQAIKDSRAAIKTIGDNVYDRNDRDSRSMDVSSKFLLAMALTRKGEGENLQEAQGIFQSVHTHYTQKEPQFLDLKYRDEYVFALSDLWYARCLQLRGQKQLAIEILNGLLKNDLFKSQRAYSLIASGMISEM
jgi:tetratricopeptide (TPR) repeat protein